MTEFNEWYARTPKNFPASLNNLSSLLRQAYEAGAASQDGTLRDKFAGQALAYFSDLDFINDKVCANWCYEMADAMLEARKVAK
jgi:hypothetical protein